MPYSRPVQQRINYPFLQRPRPPFRQMAQLLKRRLINPTQTRWERGSLNTGGLASGASPVRAPSLSRPQVFPSANPEPDAPRPHLYVSSARVPQEKVGAAAGITAPAKSRDCAPTEARAFSVRSTSRKWSPAPEQRDRAPQSNAEFREAEPRANRCPPAAGPSSAHAQTWMARYWEKAGRVA